MERTRSSMTFARLGLLALGVLAMVAQPAAAAVAADDECAMMGNDGSTDKGCECEGKTKGKETMTCKFKTGHKKTAKYFCGEDTYSDDCTDDFCTLKKAAKGDLNCVAGSSDTCLTLLEARDQVERMGTSTDGCNELCGGHTPGVWGANDWNFLSDTSGASKCFCKPTAASGPICKFRYTKDFLHAKWKSTYQKPVDAKNCSGKDETGKGPYDTDGKTLLTTDWECDPKKKNRFANPFTSKERCKNPANYSDDTDGTAAKAALIVFDKAVLAAKALSTNKLTEGAIAEADKVLKPIIDKCVAKCVDKCECKWKTQTTTQLQAKLMQKECTAQEEPKAQKGVVPDGKGTCRFEEVEDKCKWVFNEQEWGASSSQSEIKKQKWSKDNMPPYFTSDHKFRGQAAYFTNPLGTSMSYSLSKPFFCQTEKFWKDKYDAGTSADKKLLEGMVTPKCGPCVFASATDKGSLCDCVPFYGMNPIENGQECSCGLKDGKAFTCGKGKFCYTKVGATRDSCQDTKIAGLAVLYNKRVRVAGRNIILPVLIVMIICALIGSAIAWKFRSQLCGCFKGGLTGTVGATSGVVKTVANPLGKK